jgi:hypothetical protein
MLPEADPPEYKEGGLVKLRSGIPSIVKVASLISHISNHIPTALTRIKVVVHVLRARQKLCDEKRS